MLPADLLDVKTYEQTAGSVWVVLVSKDDKCDSMLTKSIRRAFGCCGCRV